MILLNISSLCGEPMRDGHQLQCQEVFALELFQFCYHQHLSRVGMCHAPLV